jgi:hypothetical protein
MNVAKFRKRTIFAFVALLLFTPIGIAEGQSVTQLTVTVTGQTLTAGFNNNVTVTVTNSYFSGNVYPSSAIYDVDIGVSLPTPLQMFGNNHWRYDSIALKQSVTMNFQVYAPTSAIGSSYQGTITVVYRELGDISYTQETHAISLAVRGWINLVLYGVQLASSAPVPGGNATISGNLLNSGNLAAYNANVTVKSDALAPTSASSLFLGEIDPNIPRPFSLLISFKKNLAEGNYSIVLRVTVIDTNMPASPYSVQQTSRIQIRKPVERPTITPQSGASGLMGTILEILRLLFGLFFGSQTLPMPFELSTVFSESIRTSRLGS